MGRTGSGVETREKSIRLSFTLQDGRTERQTLCIDGKPIRPTPANVKYAHRVAKEIKESIAFGTFKMGDYFPHASAVKTVATVSEVLETFLNSVLCEKSSLNGYKAASNFWKETIGSKPAKHLKRSEILAAIKTKPMLSGKTVNNYVSVLRQAFALMIADGDMTVNPVGTFEVPYQAPPVDPFTKDEVNLILADMRKHYPAQVANYTQAKFFTGMRTSESFGLRWGNVDLNSEYILIVDTVVAEEEKSRTKTGVVRKVRLNSMSKAAFEDQRKHTQLAGEHVFLDPRRNAPWLKEQFFTRFYWAPTLKRLGIRYHRAYNTRHTYATMMLMAGMNPAFCAKQLGHDIKMFLEVYARWLDGAADDVEMGRLEAAFFPGSSPNKPSGAASA